MSSGAVGKSISLTDASSDVSPARVSRSAYLEDDFRGGPGEGDSGSG